MNRSARAYIDLGKVRKNFDSLVKKASPSKIIATVKADAYGHGAIKVSKMLSSHSKEDFRKNPLFAFGVGTLDEADELRKNGITEKIILFTPPPMNAQNDIKDLDVITLISAKNEIEFLPDDATFFLALDTGMGRIGFLPDEILDMKTLSEKKNVIGLFSHLSSADGKREKDREYTQKQIKLFTDVAEKLENNGARLDIKTIANSYGTMNYKDSHFDAVRPGYLLYKDAMSVSADIVHIKQVPKGTAIGYNRKFVTKRESIIGTLPIGYADGVYRAAKNGKVLVGGKLAKIVGNICMDQLMIDLTDIKNVKEYDEAFLLEPKKLPATDIAKKVGTIDYEVMVRFGQRLPRIYK